MWFRAFWCLVCASSVTLGALRAKELGEGKGNVGTWIISFLWAIQWLRSFTYFQTLFISTESTYTFELQSIYWQYSRRNAKFFLRALAWSTRKLIRKLTNYSSCRRFKTWGVSHHLFTQKLLEEFAKSFSLTVYSGTCVQLLNFVRVRWNSLSNYLPWNRQAVRCNDSAR